VKIKLHRDKVVSVVGGKDLVGVYINYPHFAQDTDGTIGKYFDDVLLAEVSPAKADEIIKLWERVEK